MTLFEYYVSLRRVLIAAITGVEDARGYLFWDNTTPNSVTRSSLNAIHERYLKEARRFGLYVVTRHADCPNPSHEGHPIDNSYGLSIVYKDQNYVWPGGQMYQGERNCKCPCSSENEPSYHHVIDDVIYDKSADQKICKALERVLSDIFLSIGSSGDNKARSAIRENLLRAILEINDQIMPVSVDEYIDHYLAITADSLRRTRSAE